MFNIQVSQNNKLYFFKISKREKKADEENVSDNRN